MKTLTVQELKLTPEITISKNVDYMIKYVGRGSDFEKIDVKFIHAKPGMRSRINIKAVLYDQAQFDISAMLVIHKGAYDTDTYLKIDCLLVSETSRARAVPSLEIEEDQVKAGHGASVGMLDPRQILYLTSRGLTPETATETIISAFLDN